ncbi:MAG: RluA family pseudouridine synthase [Magnetococcales bacterium]|nr:RluA family pseudouridine synthase [Magnetococcales bacterium]MBF0156434.1 RluA family pseudouridine synthase [Magnetococcales bacterium]
MDESEGWIRSSPKRAVVDREVAGMRLDRYVRQMLPGVPGPAIQRLLRTGQVRVNGGRVKGGRRLLEGDEVRLPPAMVLVDPGNPPLPDSLIDELRGRILYRDAAVLLLDKPAGMAVHGGSGRPWGVVDGVRALWRREGLAGEPQLAHRLDQGTSGALLFGLTPSAVRRLAADFASGRVEKRYLALVRGAPADSGRIDQGLIKGATRAGERVVVAGHGQEADTGYRVVARFEGASLLVVTPGSGRTHQIRVHLQWLGHPLAGDDKYGDHRFNRQMARLGLARMFLHAACLNCTHPESGERLRLTAPLEVSLRHFLEGWAGPLAVEPLRRLSRECDREA